MDFAFFCVNFGFSKADYDELTMTERAFILRAWEDKKVADSTLIQNAVEVAVYNVNRKKSKPPLTLWRKPSRRADLEEKTLAIEKAQRLANRFGKAAAALIAGEG
jgi:hypothetical protein